MVWYRYIIEKTYTERLRQVWLLKIQKKEYQDSRFKLFEEILFNSLNDCKNYIKNKEPN